MLSAKVRKRKLWISAVSDSNLTVNDIGVKLVKHVHLYAVYQWVGGVGRLHATRPTSYGIRIEHN